MTTAPKPRKLAVLVRRDQLGQVYSEIRDLNGDPYYSSKGGETYAVTIDRQRGRLLDMETICNRAGYLAELLGLPLDVDLRQVCVAVRGLICHCPVCIEKTRKARATS